MSVTRPFQSRPCRQPGFTLIELMVVISIISMLISILLPALGAARTAARTSQCLSQIRQISLANRLYAADNKDYLSPASLGMLLNTGNVHERPWSFILMRDGYLPTARIYDCPGSISQIRPPTESFNMGWHEVQPTWSWPSQGAWVWANYGYNWSHVGTSRRYAHSGSGEGPPARLDEFEEPSRTLEFVDARGLNTDMTEYGGRYLAGDTGTETSGVVHPRHNTSANVVWADGHVTSESVPDVSLPYANSIFGKWRSTWFRKDR